jgi:protein-S-isoprenylcysteine O-methyltransferase Ste14
MTAQDTAVAALGACIVFFLLAFGLRSVVHHRRTGSTGFIGISGRPDSAEWWGGALFTLALAAGLAAPILQLIGVVVPAAALESPWLRGAGVALYVLGVTGTLWAQFAMGDSWRIGVDTAARTALVASGPFRWVRNPIFTAMTTATVGLALFIPNVVSLVAVIALLVALEVQVRLVEEPYLIRAHGQHYQYYAARTGRFLPGVGRLETAPGNGG